MARLYPDTLDGVEVRSPAERRLFEVFRDQLGDRFVVMHSVAWLGIRTEGSPPVDGEADFVILHPAMGVLVVEVKGGLVGYNGNEWYSRRSDGSVVEIKDPFAQARRSKYALLRKIESLPNWPGRTPAIGHAVAFPDGTVELPDLGPEAPREIILLHDDLAKVETWVRGCLKFWAGESFVPPGEDGTASLIRLLRRTWEMREPRLGEQIGPEETSIHRYTSEQFWVLDLLSRRPRAAICGCAGSGKTILAMEKARRLASEGFETLLTCYNRNLAEYMKASLPALPRLKVQGFHALCQEYAVRTGRDARPDWDASRPDFFETTMPNALADAATVLGPEAGFDAIVADEGQDFAETWWTALQMLLRDQDRGVFYVFYDDNQVVYPRSPSLPVEDLPFTLSVNCRNTRAIHSTFVSLYRSNAAATCVGPEGRPVEWMAFGDGKTELRAALTETLTRLVHVEEVPARDIVVLSPGGPDRPPLKGMKPPGVFRLSEAKPERADDVWCPTIRQFKGLESALVILIAPPDMQPREELLYVGLSRARNHAVVLVAADIEAEIRAALQQPAAT
jgi:predicted ATPase